MIKEFNENDVEWVDGYYIIKNPRRIEPNDFEAKYHCHVCDRKKEKFQQMFINIPFTSMLVCNTCLNNWMTLLNKTMVNMMKTLKQGE